jgi:hypothetical protein
MTHRDQVFKKYNLDKNKSYSLSEISRITSIKKSDLEEVQKRGEGAWKTNIESVRVKGTFKKDPSAPRSAKLTAEQWGMSRIFAFINKLDKAMESRQPTIDQDSDIAKKYLPNIKYK